MQAMKCFDAHLDMAMNALDHERDQTLTVSALREREQGGVGDGRGVATVSLDELRAGGCGVVLSTARAAADLDFELTIVADGCADTDAEVHRVLTEKVFARAATVTTAAELIDALR